MNVGEAGPALRGLPTVCVIIGIEFVCVHKEKETTQCTTFPPSRQGSE